MDALLEALPGQTFDLPKLLESASESGAVGIACVILHRGTSANTLKPEQIAQLVSHAVRKNNEALVLLLISCGATFHLCGAAVRHAAEAGHSHMVSLLSEAGCPLEEPNERQEAPVHLAAS